MFCNTKSAIKCHANQKAQALQVVHGVCGRLLCFHTCDSTNASENQTACQLSNPQNAGAKQLGCESPNLPRQVSNRRMRSHDTMVSSLSMFIFVAL